jgi:hypothetical protein
LYENNKNRDSSVGIATDYGLDDQMIWVGNFSLRHRVQSGSGAHPASYAMGMGALSLGLKRPGREADHSPPSIAEVKECMELHLQPQYAFIPWCLDEHRDKFTFFMKLIQSGSVECEYFTSALTN